MVLPRLQVRSLKGPKPVVFRWSEKELSWWPADQFFAMLTWPLSIARWSPPLTYAKNLYIFLEAACLHLSSFFSILYTYKAVLLSGSYIYLGSLDAGHQGSSLSDHRKTTGFGPFKLSTRSSLLQKGRDHSPPKAFLEESSTCFNLEYLGIRTWCWTWWLTTFLFFSFSSSVELTLTSFACGSLQTLLKLYSYSLLSHILSLLVTSLPLFVVSKCK